MRRLLKKTMRDLFRDKRRASFSLFAILIGTISFGIITFSYEIISRELVSAYDAINPASGSIMVDRVDDRLISLTDSFSEIADYEQKAYYELRVQTGENQWKTLELFSAENFNTLAINKITGERGSFQPGEGEVLIERDAVKVAGAEIGDILNLSLPDGSTKDLTITGIVADIGLHPASIHDTVYAYISYNTLSDMGFTGNRIDFVVTGEKYNKEHILTISNDYIKLLEQNGYVVSDLEVSNTPGVSMHLEEYESALFLLQIFSFVSFLFGCMIMSSLISSILSGQTRQIGILKGIGADTGKIIVSYMLAFFLLILCVAGVSIVFSTLLAGEVSSALMGLGNMHPADTSVPMYLYGIYGGLSLLVPMMIAFFPIRRGIAISVKDAINDYGVSAAEAGINLPAPTFLSRPVLLSLGNALQHKRRFLLNVAILSVAGALFVSVVTVMLSIQITLSNNLKAWKFDYHYTTSTVYKDNEELDNIMANIPNVTGYEIWGSSRGMLLHDNGEMIGSYPILSPPNGSTVIEPQMMEGKWITDAETSEIVMSHKFFISEPSYQVGDTIRIQIGNEIQGFIIAGSMKDFGQTAIYMSESGFQQFIPKDNQLSNVKLNLDIQGRSKAVYRAAEAALKEQGVLILQSQSKTDLNAIASGHYAVTLQTFLFIICMLVLVSGFGLAAAMNVQTSERTKEIGIMKAMGTSKKQIAKIVTSESILIALISWLVSVLLGIPLSTLGVYIFGSIILETPLQFSVLSLIVAYVVWLALTFAVGHYASRSCTEKAANMSIRDSLAFE